ncbi:hypothetical protein AB9M62_10330 [Bacillales bacterium AN1005]
MTTPTILHVSRDRRGELDLVKKLDEEWVLRSMMSISFMDVVGYEYG